MASSQPLLFDWAAPAAPTLRFRPAVPAKFRGATPHPFFKWVGGKAQLLPAIASRLPKTFSRKVSTYVEPFVGGGAVLFWMLRHVPTLKQVIINDWNPVLTTAYTVVRDNVTDLIDYLTELQARYRTLEDEDERREFFYEKRAQFNLQTLDYVTQTGLFLFLNRTCFNGLYRENSKGQFNVPFGRYTNPLICDEATLVADSEALKHVEIRCGDFSEMGEYARPGAFFYFDPPYRPLSQTSSFCEYSKDGFSDEEQMRLAHFCREIAKSGAKWLLSNSDPKGKNSADDFFDSLYDGFNIQRVQASRALNSNPAKRGKLSELLIGNY